MKTGKYRGMDDIPSELISGVEGTVKALTALCQKNWEQKKWPTQWNKSPAILVPKKGSLRQCQDCRTISLASHSIKVMQALEQDGVQSRISPTAET